MRPLSLHRRPRAFLRAFIWTSTLTLASGVLLVPPAAQASGNGWSHYPISSTDGDVYPAVSCATPKLCVEVQSPTGQSGDTGKSYESNNGGKTWKALPDTGLFGMPGEGQGLTEVSCPTKTYCVAAAGNDAVVLNGKKKKWSSVAKLPSQAYFSGQQGDLSCAPNTEFCAAGGTDGADVFGVWYTQGSNAWSFVEAQKPLKAA